MPQPGGKALQRGTNRTRPGTAQMARRPGPTGLWSVRWTTRLLGPAARDAARREVPPLQAVEALPESRHPARQRHWNRQDRSSTCCVRQVQQADSAHPRSFLRQRSRPAGHGSRGIGKCLADGPLPSSATMWRKIPVSRDFQGVGAFVPRQEAGRVRLRLPARP